MSAKQLVLETVREMSDKATMDEIVERLVILAAIRRGEEAADKGKAISHEKVKKHKQLDFLG